MSRKKVKKQSRRLTEPRTFTRPRAYYLDKGYGRLRILYPDGKTEISGGYYAVECNSHYHNDLATFDNAAFCDGFHFGRGCWNDGTFKTGFDALAAMREYDRYNLNNPAIFLGEF